MERPSSDSRAKRRKRQDFVGKYCEDSSDELSESCTSGSSYNPSGGGAADTDSSSQDLDSEESPPDNNETNGEKSTSENQKRNNSLKLNSNKVESSSSIIISEDKSGNQNRSKTIEKSKVKNNSGTVSEKDRIECCYLYKQGTKIELLTERYGVQADAIRSWRRKYAPETLLARNNSKYDKNTILEACRKLKKGESIASVASKMGISTNTISRWKDMYFKVRVQKGESRSSCKYSEYTKLEALDRLHRGIESRVVAKDLKINVKLVLEWKDPNYSPLKPVTLREEPVDQRKYDKNFIRKVCERILRGESGKKIARELGMSSSLLSKWRHKYCLDKKPEPTNGVKYNKSAILKACELLKQGVAIKDVAQELQVDHYAIRRWKRNYLGDSEIKMFSRKYHSIETVLRFAKNLRKHETSTVLEAYKLMKKGNSSKDVANKLKLDCALVSKWRRDYFVTDHLPRSSKLKDVKVQVCERLRQGDPVRKLSKEFGIYKPFDFS